MTTPRPGTVRAFGIWGSDGPVELELPMAWALDVSGIRVQLEHTQHFGWQAALRAGEVDVLTFGWSDHVDELLLSDSDELPSRAPEDEWSDLEQCWWASIHRVGEHLFIAETSFDDLLECLPATPTLVEPGTVRVRDTVVTWFRVSAEEYDAA